MNLKIDCGYICELDEFSINEIKARYEDFGTKCDEDPPEDAQVEGCGTMTFIGESATQEVLNKYKITLKEYKEVVKQLEKILSFGSCGICV